MPKLTKLKAADFSKHFLAKKTLYGPKKDPVWVYLEREMQENINKKPYNNKVGDWLKFLRDLKHYFYLEGKKHERILKKEIGPLWYIEMSGYQKEVLHHLVKDIHYDLIENMPRRTRKSLLDLGITRSISRPVLLKAMAESGEDAALFIWKLYTAIYNKSPSETRGEYDMDAMILMSALTFIDIEECLENLKDLTKPVTVVKAPEPVKKKKVSGSKKGPKNKWRYSEYLERSRIPIVCRHPSPQRQKVKLPQPRMEKKITIRSDDSYEKLRLDNSFIDRRLLRSVKAKQAERICTYKFWEPPVYLRSSSPEMEAYFKKLKLLQKSAKACHMTQYENIQFNVGPVVLVGGRPRYLLNNIAVLPTGYIAINGGTMLFPSGEYLTIISGSWRFPTDREDQCDPTCQCEKWEEDVMKYLKESKCSCGHRYDYYLEGKPMEKYFYPPTKHMPMWFDEAKVFQIDPMEDFIKDTVRWAERSREPTPTPSPPELSTSGINTKALLQSFLADLSGTALVIPHLPQAFLLNNLLEWVRQRFNGDLTPDAHKNSLLKSLRRWLWLKHMDFRERAYMIPFTKHELENITWADRSKLQTLFETLLRDFTTRNRLRQLQQTRLWWSTMKFDRYPSKEFLDVYFTYMPGRPKDTYVFNPFNIELTPNDIFKTCPL